MRQDYFIAMCYRERARELLNPHREILSKYPLYITIDKQELPSELRYDTQSRILASQIPDNARFKYFMINWD